MQSTDVYGVVNVHLSSFHGFFLTQLGPKFLVLLYSYIVSSPDGIGYVALDRGRVVGFVCGSIQPSGFYWRFVLKQWKKLISVVPPVIMQNPFIIGRLIWRFIAPPQASVRPGTATLFSIGVMPEYQNKGIGKALIQIFLNAVRQHGVHEVNLTTDRDNNESTNAFYQRLGFRLVRSYKTPEGRWMNEYAIELVGEDHNA